MGPTSSGRGPNKIAIRVFISHSSADHLLAQKIVRLLELGLDVPKGAIRCSSSPEHEVPPGDSVPDTLRQDLRECAAVIALMTPDSVFRSYVLMELGASWALKETTSELAPPNYRVCLLLAPGVCLADLPGPLQSLQVTKMSNVGAMSRMLESVAKSTGLTFNKDQPELKAAMADFEAFVKTLPHRLPWLRRASAIGALAAAAAAIFAGLVWYFCQPRHPIVLFTGTPGGQFNKLGEWLQEAMAAENVALQVKATDGSVENCERIENADATTVALAWTSRQCGATTEHPENKARVVVALFPEVLHFLVYKDSDTPGSLGSLPDLRGKKVYVGADRSGTRLSVKRLLSKSEYEDAEVKALISNNHELSNGSFDAAAVLLQDGKIDAAFLGTGLGAPAVVKALAKRTVRLVPLPAALLENMTKDDPDRHFAYASLATDEQLKAAYQPNTYGLTSAGYLAPNPDAERTSSYRFDSFASNAVLMAPESVDKVFLERLLEILRDPNNRKVVVDYNGVSGTYLEQSQVLNDRMQAKGILLNSYVTDRVPLWFYRGWPFAAGVLLIFVAVTVGAAEHFKRRVKS